MNADKNKELIEKSRTTYAGNTFIAKLAAALEKADARIVKLESINKGIESGIDCANAEAVMVRQQNAALAAQVEKMRAALDCLHKEKIDYMVRNNLGNPYLESATKLACKALALSTKSASEVLEEFEKKVIERCAAHVDCPVIDTGYGFAAALRALIAAPKEKEVTG